VVSSIDGLLEVVENGVTGFLSVPGDARELAESIAEVMADAEHAHMVARRGQSVAVERFGMDRYQREIVAAVVGPAA
jgi:glycosyltransferase involved in cell wall biosynthesis